MSFGTIQEVPVALQPAVMRVEVKGEKLLADWFAFANTYGIVKVLTAFQTEREIARPVLGPLAVTAVRFRSEVALADATHGLDRLYLLAGGTDGFVLVLKRRDDSDDTFIPILSDELILQLILTLEGFFSLFNDGLFSRSLILEAYSLVSQL